MKTVTVQSILLNAAAAILPIARDIEQQLNPSTLNPQPSTE